MASNQPGTGVSPDARETEAKGWSKWASPPRPDARQMVAVHSYEFRIKQKGKWGPWCKRDSKVLGVFVVGDIVSATNDFDFNMDVKMKAGDAIQMRTIVEFREYSDVG